MSEAPRDGTEIIIYHQDLQLCAYIASFDERCKLWVADTFEGWRQDDLAGWLPIPYPDEDDDQ
jgi:hypothetical protein